MSNSSFHPEGCLWTSSLLAFLVFWLNAGGYLHCQAKFSYLGAEDLISTISPRFMGLFIFFKLIKIFALLVLLEWGHKERSLGPDAEKIVSKPKFTHFTIWGQFCFFVVEMPCFSPMSLLRLPVPTTLSSTLLIPQSIRSSAKNWL